MSGQSHGFDPRSSSKEYKHLYQEFRTKHKVFLFHIVNFGRSIRIIERNRVNSYYVDFDLGQAFRLYEFTKEAIAGGPGRKLRRVHRGQNSTIIMESGKNRAGVFLKFIKICRGSWENIFIPGEAQARGWEGFFGCLHNIFYSEKRGGSEVLAPKKVGVGDGRSFLEALKSGNVYQEALQRENEIDGNLQAGSQASLAEKKVETPIDKKKLKPVVIYRFQIRWSWGVILQSLKRRVGGETELVTFAADRAMCWVDEGGELSLFKDPFLFAGKNSIAKVEAWKMEVHWEGIKIAAKFSWIGVEGLPLNLWNEEMFMKIGEACGGTLEIAEETRSLSFLSFAKIKVRGFSSGFLNPLVIIPVGESKIHVGLFSMENRFSGWCTGRTLGMMARKQFFVENCGAKSNKEGSISKENSSVAPQFEYDEVERLGKECLLSGEKSGLRQVSVGSNDVIARMAKGSGVVGGCSRVFSGKEHKVEGVGSAGHVRVFNSPFKTQKDGPFLSNSFNVLEGENIEVLDILGWNKGPVNQATSHAPEPLRMWKPKSQNSQFSGQVSAQLNSACFYNGLNSCFVLSRAHFRKKELDSSRKANVPSFGVGSYKYTGTSPFLKWKKDLEGLNKKERERFFSTLKIRKGFISSGPLGSAEERKVDKEVAQREGALQASVFSLGKEVDRQEVGSVSRTLDSKLKSLWGKGYFRKLKRDKKQWILEAEKDVLGEEEEDRQGTMKEVLEEDLVLLLNDNNSAKEDLEESEGEILSFPDSEEEGQSLVERDFFLQDISSMFKEECNSLQPTELVAGSVKETPSREIVLFNESLVLQDNKVAGSEDLNKKNLSRAMVLFDEPTISQHNYELVGREEEKIETLNTQQEERLELMFGDDGCVNREGSLVNGGLSQEEWKLITKVLEGVELTGTILSEDKSTHKQKMKGSRELRGLRSSVNYDSAKKTTGGGKSFK